MFYREITSIYIYEGFLTAAWLNFYNIIFHFSHLLCNQLLLNSCKDKIDTSWFLSQFSITHTHTHKQTGFAPLPQTLRTGGFLLPRLWESSLTSFLIQQTHQTGITFSRCFTDIHLFMYFWRLKVTMSQAEILFDALHEFLAIKTSSWADQLPSRGCWLLLPPRLSLHFSKQCSAVHSQQSIESLSSVPWLCSQKE